jgi:hypothetical protein
MPYRPPATAIMITALAGTLVLLAGLYLVALGVVSAGFPSGATRFLGAFAGSLSLHLVELAVRFTVGASLLIYSPYMRFPEMYKVFGWVMIGTTLVLLLIPWRWHRRFAGWSVPLATRRLGLFAAASLAAGTFVVFSVLLGAGT